MVTSSNYNIYMVTYNNSNINTVDTVHPNNSTSQCSLLLFLSKGKYTYSRTER